MIFDQGITSYAYSIRTPFLDNLFIFFSVLGNPETIVSIFILLAIASWIIHRRHAWSIFFTGLILGTGVAYFLKEMIQRSRPDGQLAIIMATGYSFPSAHALVGTICYGLLGYYIYKYSKKIIIQICGLCIIIFFPLMIGISRVYLGVHWASDVIAGWIIGAFILGCFMFHLHRAYGRAAVRKTTHTEHVLLLGIVTVEAFFIFLFYFFAV